MTKIQWNDDYYSSFMLNWNRLRKGLLSFAIAVFAAVQIVLFAPQAVLAQVRDIPSGADFSNPPALNLTEVNEHNPTGELNAQWIDNKIYNPLTGSDDQVRLRGYEGMESPGAYVGGTIYVNPGDHLEIKLHNELGKEDEGTCPPSVMNIPHCFNTINLHTHGFYVSPNDDDVLRELDPGVEPGKPSATESPYSYDIPEDHPAGTFWYHPHVHGSTALQASSGMAGALIVRGDRQPQLESSGEVEHGDIDTLIPDVKENILVFQQIQYACFDDGGVLKARKEVDSEGNIKIVEWLCDPGDVGELRGYEDSSQTSLFGPNTWDESSRFSSINGLIRPEFTAEVGEIERWRMIHAGVRDTIGLQFRKSLSNLVSEDFRSLSKSGLNDFINENCSKSTAIRYHIIANDGLTRGKAWETELETLQPGYRSDALVVFPDAGDYCVLDDSAPEGSLGSPDRQLLGVVHVAPSPRIPGSIENIHDYLKQTLAEKALVNIGDPLVAAEIHDDIQNNDISLTSFTHHDDIQAGEVTNYQYLTFNIDTRTDADINNKYQISNMITDDPNDFNSFNPERTDRKLPLGETGEWELESNFASHPFHIHINPFQIVEILDPNGNDVSDPNTFDILTDIVDPQYRGLKGVWKDTLWVKNVTQTNPDNGPIIPDGRYHIVVRTRYEGGFTGPFVLHCHILDHEDQGMMQKICITNHPDEADPTECNYIQPSA